jgi:hypothetical protein
VKLVLALQDLGIWDADMRPAIVRGEYEVMTGPDSAHLQSASLKVTGGAR